MFPGSFPAPQPLNITYDIDGYRSSEQGFLMAGVARGVRSMDAVERWFLITAATSCFVLIGLGLLT